MKNYNVRINVPVTFEFSVDANSREEALKKLFEEKAYSDCRLNTLISFGDIFNYSCFSSVYVGNTEYEVDVDNGTYAEKEQRL